MPLMHNIRRPSTEPYDPKQRIVGGIVLFLLMLFIYSLLKLVLGLSNDIDASYLPERSEAINGKSSLTDEVTHLQKKLTSNQRHLLPRGFVFLDLKGKPMQPDLPVPKDKSDERNIFEPNGEERWYVQAASFKNEGPAQRLVEKIKAKGIVEEVHIIQTTNKKWYMVRLPPQTEYSSIVKQQRQLRTLLGIRKTMTKKID
jgi:hypothetical protein